MISNWAKECNQGSEGWQSCIKEPRSGLIEVPRLDYRTEGQKSQRPKVDQELRNEGTALVFGNDGPPWLPAASFLSSHTRFVNLVDLQSQANHLVANMRRRPG